MRQLMFSAIRERRVCSDRRLVAEQQAGDDDGEHAGGVELLRREEGDVRRGERQRGVQHRVVDVLADRARARRRRRDRRARRRRRRARSPNRRATRTTALNAAMAVFRATRAVASLTRLSPSRIDTMRRGMPTRRAIVVAATASGGATTAPRAKPAASVRPGHTHHATRPTTTVEKATRPTDSSGIGRRLALKSTSDVRIAAA